MSSIAGCVKRRKKKTRKQRKKNTRKKNTRKKKTRKKKTRKKRGGVVPKRFEKGAKWQPKVEFPNRKTTLEILPWKTDDVISTFSTFDDDGDEREDIQNTVDHLHQQGWLLLAVKQINTDTRQIVQSTKMLHKKWDLDNNGKYLGNLEH